MVVPGYLQTKDTNADKTGATTFNISLENNGFFPAIELRDFESRYQIDESYSESRRLQLLQLAMQQANAELMQQVCYWQNQGWYELKDVPQQAFGNCGEFVFLYCTAVYARAMQLLNQRYRATDTQQQAVPKSSTMEQVSTQYENEYRAAIYRLTNHIGHQVTVELI